MSEALHEKRKLSFTVLLYYHHSIQLQNMHFQPSPHKKVRSFSLSLSTQNARHITSQTRKSFIIKMRWFLSVSFSYINYKKLITSNAGMEENENRRKK